jgi:hypothetical protein
MAKVNKLVVEAKSEHGEDITECVQNNLIVDDLEIRNDNLQKLAHVFLWAEVVVKMLNKAYNDGKFRAMKKVLWDVPVSLNNLYSQLPDQGGNVDEVGERVLMFWWVLFAEEALSPEELYFVVLAGTDAKQLGAWDRAKEPRAIIQRCASSISKGPIEIPANNSNTQFIHESVRDFLLGAKGLQSLDSSTSQHLVGSSHSHLASSCFSYIMMKSLEILEAKDDPGSYYHHFRHGDGSHPIILYPLLTYASAYNLHYM